MQNRGMHVSARSSALRVLFTLYLTGRIADTMWRQMMDVFDACAANGEEREALALFFMEALRELGPESTKIPQEDEFNELMTMMHSA